MSSRRKREKIIASGTISRDAFLITNILQYFFLQRYQSELFPFLLVMQLNVKSKAEKSMFENDE
ncbi:hypothetical protein T06_6562 [Trichinella sp. T6]|nr:hypothetical protein T06_6562 [Trichinella sp. T6]